MARCAHTQARAPANRCPAAAAASHTAIRARAPLPRSLALFERGAPTQARPSTAQGHAAPSTGTLAKVPLALHSAAPLRPRCAAREPSTPLYASAINRSCRCFAFCFRGRPMSELDVRTCSNRRFRTPLERAAPASAVGGQQQAQPDSPGNHPRRRAPQNPPCRSSPRRRPVAAPSPCPSLHPRCRALFIHPGATRLGRRKELAPSLRPATVASARLQT